MTPEGVRLAVQIINDTIDEAFARARGGDRPTVSFGYAVERIVKWRNAAINDKLEEAAANLEALADGTYTATNTPAQLVRAMKVK